MLSRVVLSVAFLAAAVVPVISVPVTGAQGNVTQPTVQPASTLNQTTYDNLIDGFLSTLSAEQAQELSTILQAALNGTDPTVSVTPTTTNSTTQPQKRQFGDLVGILAGNAAKRAPMPSPDAKRWWTPPPIPSIPPIPTPPPIPSCWRTDSC